MWKIFKKNNSKNKKSKKKIKKNAKVSKKEKRKQKHILFLKKGNDNQKMSKKNQRKKKASKQYPETAQKFYSFKRNVTSLQLMCEGSQFLATFKVARLTLQTRKLETQAKKKK